MREYQRSRDKKAWQHIEGVIMSRLDEMKGAEGKKKATPVLSAKRQSAFHE